MSSDAKSVLGAIYKSKLVLDIYIYIYILLRNKQLSIKIFRQPQKVLQLHLSALELSWPALSVAQEADKNVSCSVVGRGGGGLRAGLA